MCPKLRNAGYMNGEYPGGAVIGGAPPFTIRDEVKLGSRFLPFDLHFFTFAGAPFDKATQQAAFKTLNEDIVKIAPPVAASDSAIEEVITAMYAGGLIQNETFVLPSWNAQPIERGMYRDVVGHTCRSR
jgi:hypothetical protein